jgi:hypothetical protein
MRVGAIWVLRAQGESGSDGKFYSFCNQRFTPDLLVWWLWGGARLRGNGEVSGGQAEVEFQFD